MKKSVRQANFGFITLITVCLLFSGCTPMSHSSAFTFNYYETTAKTDEPNYVLMKDSSRVYGGTKIKASKKYVYVDDKKIPSADVLGFQNKVGFWAKVNMDESTIVWARRLVYGKISVYSASEPPPNGWVAYFYQKDTGPIDFGPSRWSQFKEMVKDCPKAFDMANISDDECKKALRKDLYYTQHIIETYNACGWK